MKYKSCLFVRNPFQILIRTILFVKMSRRIYLSISCPIRRPLIAHRYDETNSSQAMCFVLTSIKTGILISFSASLLLSLLSLIVPFRERDRETPKYNEYLKIQRQNNMLYYYYIHTSWKIHVFKLSHFWEAGTEFLLVSVRLWLLFIAIVTICWYAILNRNNIRSCWTHTFTVLHITTKIMDDWDTNWSTYFTLFWKT